MKKYLMICLLSALAPTLSHAAEAAEPAKAPQNLQALIDSVVEVRGPLMDRIMKRVTPLIQKIVEEEAQKTAIDIVNQVLSEIAKGKSPTPLDSSVDPSIASAANAIRIAAAPPQQTPDAGAVIAMAKNPTKVEERKAKKILEEEARLKQ